MTRRRKVTTLTMAVLLLGAGVLTGCGSDTETEAAACVTANTSTLTGINDTLAAYGTDELTDAYGVTVNLAGAGTMKWTSLVAGKLASGETAIYAESAPAGFIVPLNGAAIASMPDAAVDGGVVSVALNSTEGQFVVACVK